MYGDYMKSELEILNDKNDFLVIGLVGAVGCRLKSLSNILKSLLDSEFGYDVKELHVSKEFLQTHSLVSTYNNSYERYTDLMNVGNNLRKKYDNNYLSFKIAKEISKLRKDNLDCKRKAFIINSLKHDKEIKTLRDIYGKNFYQISLYESPNIRKDVLINDIGMNESQAIKLMEREQSEENDYGQHIIDAFHLADYFIKYDNKTNEHIKNSCKRFLELIFGNPYITPTFNEFSMYMAYTSGLRSADLSRQVGAVITKERNIISTGANDIPKFGGGLYWPEYNEENGEIYDIGNGRDYVRGYDSNQKEKEKIIKSIFSEIKNKFDCIFNEENLTHKENMKNLLTILKNSPLKDITEYGRVVHAEMDAILACGRTNNSTVGSSIFVTTFPCHNCAKHILAAGIKEVFFIEPYPKSRALDLWDDSMELKLPNSSNDKLQFSPFVGVGPRSFLDLFSMAQSAGSKIIRKSNGEKISWDPKEATLRLSSNTFSLNEIEKDIIAKLEEIEQPVN